MKIFYTYLWLRDDGTPYYAGKGHGNRAFIPHRGWKLKPPKNLENILIQEWPDERGALDGEKLLIAIYGREDQRTGGLLNMTDGGDGVIGYTFTPEAKAKCRAAAQKSRHPLTAAHKEKLRALRAGTTLSADHKEKIRLSLRGNQRARNKHWHWHEKG